uniref:Uncharacterized protein n=1 Tax=Cacopsylla melanoneura TaxID=428564 RepID=A0A8D8LLW5_9HEMI
MLVIGTIKAVPNSFPLSPSLPSLSFHYISISSSNVISYYDYRIPFFPHVCMVKIVILLFHSFFPNAFAFDTGVSVFFFFFKGEKCSQEHHLKLEISKKEKT